MLILFYMYAVNGLNMLNDPSHTAVIKITTIFDKLLFYIKQSTC